MHVLTRRDPVRAAAGISLIAAGLSLFRLRRAILPILQSRFVWAPVTLFLIILFNSGYMWNRIRDAPYMTKDRQGNSQWMAGGFQQQLGAETQVVGVICASNSQPPLSASNKGDV
jgi:oligosaccharyltransferase complex subunit gamma